VYRQYLQINYVKGLLNIQDPKSSGYDDVAKAGALNTLKKIKTLMATAVSTNEETKAHRANVIYLINYGLEAR
jgi:hypothetical protein